MSKGKSSRIQIQPKSFLCCVLSPDTREPASEWYTVTVSAGQCAQDAALSFGDAIFDSWSEGFEKLFVRVRHPDNREFDYELTISMTPRLELRRV